jgi:3-dehydro-L-gulonate 2-dehydrogenase
MTTPEYLKVPKQTMQSEFYRILIKHGFTQSKAEECAAVFTENSLDGVYTHGVNRFPRFIKYTIEGVVKPDQIARCKHNAGSIEQWDGQGGPGPLNAIACTERAMELASQHAMGCVALANTNHWMRGGTYGRRAARAGFIFIGWTNTMANMPAWGAVDNKLGNNPLVIGVPYKDEAIVLDMAMSQYSYGALELYEMKNEVLPVVGGFDQEGRLTNDPASIRQSRRVLPIGYWKGAGLSLLLDILGTVLSGGLSTASISKQKTETNLSQVFIAIDSRKLSNVKSIADTVYQIINDYHQSQPENKTKKIPYPGEKVLMTREENNRSGIPVIKSVWEEILAL